MLPPWQHWQQCLLPGWSQFQGRCCWWWQELHTWGCRAHHNDSGPQTAAAHLHTPLNIIKAYTENHSDVTLTLWINTLPIYDQHSTSNPPITSRAEMLNFAMVSTIFSMCLFGRVLKKDMKQTLKITCRGTPPILHVQCNLLVTEYYTASENGCIISPVALEDALSSLRKLLTLVS